MRLKSIVRLATSYPMLLFTSTLASLALILPTFARPASLVANDPASEIRVRANPTVQANVSHIGFAGDRVEVVKQSRGADGYTWNYVKFDRSGAQGWVRSDLIRLSPEDSQPKVVRAAADVGSRSRAGLPPQGEYTSEQINYFLEIALGAEYTKTQAASTIRKWQGDLRIQTFGTPTSADLETLRTVIGEINTLTGGNIRLQLVDRNPNVTVRFVPERQFKKYEPNYEPVNYGYFWTQWSNDKIYSANILINSQQVTQKERSHLIREELTQALGLMQDSFRYADSLFYQPWTDVTQYSAIDRAVIKMLYDPRILPGMTQAQALNALNTLHATDRSVPCESNALLSFAISSDCKR